MSYARFSPDCNVYVFAVSGDELECCMCGISKGSSIRLPSLDDALAHFKKHEDAGHQVAYGGWSRLEADLRGDEDFIWNGGNPNN